MGRRVAAARRILVLGCCGSGKSYLARALEARLGLPLVRLDDLYWGPDWARPDPAIWLEAVRRAADADAWIIDGNYASSLGPRLARAELVILFDLPTPRVMASVLWRDVRRLFRSDDLPAQVRAGAARPRSSSGRLDFWRHVLRFRRSTLPPMLEELRASGAPLVVLRSRGEARRLVESLA